MLTERSHASCGVIKTRDGKEEIVVAGGWFNDGAVEIFNLEESSWRSGMEKISVEIFGIKHTSRLLNMLLFFVVFFDQVRRSRTWSRMAGMCRGQNSGFSMAVIRRGQWTSSNAEIDVFNK
jgi:hypothetical protein